MATDLDHIVRVLTTFYDFSDKTVVAVGAGGGQLLGYAEKARRVIAVDQDRERRGLAHARQMASDVLVIDHAPGSPWSWCAAEERGVAAAWDAVGHTARREIGVEAFQSFADYGELEAKLARQGPESRGRIAAYQGKTNLSIPMPYRLALI